MNNRLSKLSATVIVAMMLLYAMPIIMPAVKGTDLSGSPPSFWVEPETEAFNTATTPYPPGASFTVTVWGAVHHAGYAWSVYLGYNSAQLQVTGAAWTNGSGTCSHLLGMHSINPPDSGLPNIVITAILDTSTAGVVKAGESLTSDQYVTNDTYDTLFTVTFKIILAPPAGGSLTCNIDPAYGDATKDTWWQDLDGVFYYYDSGLSQANCVYTYKWSAPTTTPFVRVVNYTENTFDMYTHWIGTTFIECFYIDNLNSGWSLTNVTFDFIYVGTLVGVVTPPAFDALWGHSSYINGASDLTLEVDSPTTTPGTPYPNSPNGVPIANVTMQILAQADSPPKPYGYYDFSPRTITNIFAYSSLNSGWTGAPLISGVAQGGDKRQILVFAFLHALPPFLSVTSPTLGPGPVIGTTFTVPISLNEVSESAQHLVGVQFRLKYDDSILQPVDIQEGPFFPYFAALETAAGYPPAQTPPYDGTWFLGYWETDPGLLALWGPDVVVGVMLLPNDTGWWNEPLPNGTGVIAYVTFRVLAQSYGEPTVITPLTFEDESAIGLDNMVDQNIVDVVLSPSHNGQVTITVNWPGRALDLYGGAVNSGWGPLVYPTLDTTGTVTGPYAQFPAPYGGQGANAPMDMVEPQSQVYLWATVTYNYWPVQTKNVAFEIDEPDGTVYNKLSAYTDANGVAGVTFRMPWPCGDPESLFGVWHITATVQLADVVLTDTMDYHYDYLVHIWKVTTDAFQYNHGQTVQITFTYGSHAQQSYPVLFVASIIDNLGVTVGIATYITRVGGTVFSVYLNNTVTLTITIPKWAYAGIAMIHVDGFDVEPVQGGVAITPEYVGPPIAIQPY